MYGVWQVSNFQKCTFHLLIHTQGMHSDGVVKMLVGKEGWIAYIES